MPEHSSANELLGAKSQHRTPQLQEHPLNTVRLPPPTSASDGRYEWSTVNAAVNFRSHSNMLKTPESVLRPGEELGPKRLQVPPESSNKRHKPQDTPQSAYPPGKRTNAPREENAYQWPSYYSEFSFDAGDRMNYNYSNLYRVPVDYRANQSFRSQSGNLMLSPNSPPNATSYEFTPTRMDRPQSVPNTIESYNYGSTFAQRGSSTLLAPVMRPSSSGPFMGDRQYEVRVERRFAPVQGSEGVPARAMSLSGSASGDKPPPGFVLPAPEDMPPVVDDGKKPSFSYAMLIGMAILRAPERKLTLAQIYAWIVDTFKFYRESKPTWHNSIRHNLSLNKAFKKRMRPKGAPGKGNYWTISEGCEHQFFAPPKSKKINYDTVSEPERAAAQRGSGPRPLRYVSEQIMHPAMSTQQARAAEMQAGVAAAAEQAAAPSLAMAAAHSKKTGKDEIADAVSYYTHSRMDAIPSDGTEPDDQFGDDEEEEDRNAILSRKVTLRIEPAAAGELPQMHAMSAFSTPKSQEQPQQDKEETWHGQGQYTFQVPPQHSGMSRPESQPTSGPRREYGDAAKWIPREEHPGKVHFEAEPPRHAPLSEPSRDGVREKDDYHKESFEEESSQKSYSETALYVKQPTDKGKDFVSPEMPSSSSSKASQSSGSSEEPNSSPDFIPRLAPRTPEKRPRMPANLSSSKPKVQFLRPTMLHCQSLESPFAGTLELSPFVGNPHLMPATRSVSTAAFPDFLDFSLGRVSASGGKSRSTEDDNIGGGSHTSSFSLPVDFEMSPRMVVTPVRRPFDTPIRDLSQAYSPYSRGDHNAGCSPLKRK